MADDSEAMSGQDDDRDNDDVMEVVSPDGINSTTDNLPDTQLISSGIFSFLPSILLLVIPRHSKTCITQLTVLSLCIN